MCAYFDGLPPELQVHGSNSGHLGVDNQAWGGNEQSRAQQQGIETAWVQMQRPAGMGLVASQLLPVAVSVRPGNPVDSHCKRSSKSHITSNPSESHAPGPLSFLVHSAPELIRNRGSVKCTLYHCFHPIGNIGTISNI